MGRVGRVGRMGRMAVGVSECVALAWCGAAS